MREELKYTFSFRLWELGYTICTDSPKIIKFFKRAYSLFSGNHTEKSKVREQILIDIPAEDKRNDQEIIVGIQGDIIRSWMRKLCRRIIFFHASSVELKKRYILFAGGERSGKSTMAATMRNYGVRVLNDDFTPVKCDTGRVLNLPMFGNVRKGKWTDTQRRYLNPLAHYKAVRRSYLGDMSEKEFRVYHLYNKHLYGLDGNPKPDSREKKELVIIFLKKPRSTGKPRLQKARFPQSLNMFINSLQTPPELFEENFKKIFKLFGDFKCYSLRASSPEETAEFIISRFD